LLDRIWSLSSFDTAHWAEWPDEDECVLYMQKSGETAIVSTLSIAILEFLKVHPCCIEDLVSHILQCMDESVEESAVLLSIKSNLTQLQKIGAIDNDTNFISTRRAGIPGPV